MQKAIGSTEGSLLFEFVADVRSLVSPNVRNMLICFDHSSSSVTRTARSSTAASSPSATWSVPSPVTPVTPFFVPNYPTIASLTPNYSRHPCSRLAEVQNACQGRGEAAARGAQQGRRRRDRAREIAVVSSALGELYCPSLPVFRCLTPLNRRNPCSRDAGLSGIN